MFIQIEVSDSHMIMNFKKICSTSLLYFLLLPALAQTNFSSPSSIAIKSTILDTLETKLNSVEVNLLWLNDTIKVRYRNKELKIDPDIIKVLRQTDSTALTTKKEIDKYLLGMKIGGQNCYSYALQQYFEHHKKFSQNTFGASTKIGQKSAKKILNNYFNKIAELSVSQNDNFKHPIPNNSILAFVSDYDWAIHFVFRHDKLFYSKNGAFKPITFKSLRKFLKSHYTDTKKILVYTIDEDKVKSSIL